ncbi:MAG: Helix-turn-helix domain protein [Candidatus Magasanikbacteria bacterium GW2011_GWA2_56_11]|uniref:Helix-turn-helix domain protein n=1 Tax=Candidatus Magasanikbacteria bacterium GW2011_GWA2_56_11 TaxID=1619044 RepID=A0A0G1YI49_9BACT|nr:MAG: Helix-turn-helix domain protein [Candidatus Magasanikbacteria bacterium GW2011_GWA2_56_11]
MKLEELRNGLLSNVYSRGEKKRPLGLEISQMVLEARVSLGWTQQKLADRMGTKQPSIARLEKGVGLPSLSFLEKMAEVFGTRLVPPRFEFLDGATMQTGAELSTRNISRNSEPAGAVGCPFVVVDVKNLTSGYRSSQAMFIQQ